MKHKLTIDDVVVRDGEIVVFPEFIRIKGTDETWSIPVPWLHLGGRDEPDDPWPAFLKETGFTLAEGRWNGGFAVCAQCDMPMLRKDHNHIACSERCHREYTREKKRLWAKAKRKSRAKEPQQLTCQSCGDRIVARRSDRKYCSIRCRVAAHRAKE